MARVHLTDAAVAAAQLREGDYILFDERIRGLGVRVWPSGRKTFVLQRELHGRAIRCKIGAWPEWHVAQARREAQALAVKIDRGENPNAEKKAARTRGATLKDAVGWHVAAMRSRECSPRSIMDVETEIERYSPGWLKRPLAEIGRDEVARMHETISLRGKYAANRWVRHISAVWTTARKYVPWLPEKPTVVVTLHRERRRRDGIADFPAWRRAVDAAEPVLRDAAWSILLTGLRSTDARSVRWEHVNLSADPRMLGAVEIPPGCMHRPRPKGGVDRAFTVPLSKAALEVLRRRQDANVDDAGWVFPSRDARGDVVHLQHVRINGVPSPHRWRAAFASAAVACGVDMLSLRVLLNHSLSDSGPVTQGYVIPDPEGVLRGAVESVANYIFAKMELPG